MQSPTQWSPLTRKIENDCKERQLNSAWGLMYNGACIYLIFQPTTGSYYKVNIEHWAAKSRVILDSILNKGGQVLKRVEWTKYSRAITVVYSHSTL